MSQLFGVKQGESVFVAVFGVLQNSLTLLPAWQMSR